MIYVVGCNHGIQQEQRPIAQERTRQRSHFRRAIEGIVANNRIGVICEEWDDEAGRTITQDIADSRGLRWANINTTREDLRQMGIPLLYTKLLGVGAGQRACWHAEREQLMLRRIRQSRRGNDNLLVVCGFDHMVPLSELLRAGGVEVEVLDYRECDWYDPGAFGQ